MDVVKETGERVTLNQDEWDALCDGCGLCCRITHPPAESMPAAMCPGYDCEKKQCGIYDTRIGQHACIQLEPDLIMGLHRASILPASCGYVSFMQGTPKLEPKEFLCLPMSVLDREEQAHWRKGAKKYQADVEGSLKQFRQRPSL